jgi:hypothetical protein
MRHVVTLMTAITPHKRFGNISTYYMYGPSRYIVLESMLYCIYAAESARAFWRSNTFCLRFQLSCLNTKPHLKHFLFMFFLVDEVGKIFPFKKNWPSIKNGFRQPNMFSNFVTLYYFRD